MRTFEYISIITDAFMTCTRTIVSLPDVMMEERVGGARETDRQEERRRRRRRRRKR